MAVYRQLYWDGIIGILTNHLDVIWKKKRKKTVRFGIGSTKSIGRCSAHMAPLKNGGNESGVAGRQGPPGNEPERLNQICTSL